MKEPGYGSLMIRAQRRSDRDSLTCLPAWAPSVSQTRSGADPLPCR